MAPGKQGPADIIYIYVCAYVHVYVYANICIYIYIYLKAHSAGPATVPWGHSCTASENMLIVPVVIYEQVKLSPMVHNLILRVY